MKLCQNIKCPNFRSLGRSGSEEMIVGVSYGCVYVYENI